MADAPTQTAPTPPAGGGAPAPRNPLANLPAGPGVPVQQQGTPLKDGALPAQPGQATQSPPAKPQAAPASPTVEDLLKQDPSKDPALAGGHEGVDWEKTLSALPEDARKLLGNLRADYTRKSQAVAAEAKRLESERKAFTNSEAYKRLQEASTKESGQFDPYDPDAFLTRIKKEVATQILEAMQPVVEQQAADEKRQAMDTFIAQHPDLKTDTSLRVETYKLLKANEHLTLEQAYHVVRGQMDQKKAAKLEAELGTYRKAAQAAGLQVATGTRPNERRPPPEVAKGGAKAILRWLQAQGG